MAKYRKKPTVVEAHRWTWNDDDAPESFGNDHMARWLGRVYGSIPDPDTLNFVGLDGRALRAYRGDWIVCQMTARGRDCWPVSPDIFEATYQSAREPEAEVGK